MFRPENKTKLRFLINQQLDWIVCQMYTIWLRFNTYKVSVMGARKKVVW
jgi:hypothetical protein